MQINLTDFLTRKDKTRNFTTVDQSFTNSSFTNSTSQPHLKLPSQRLLRANEQREHQSQSYVQPISDLSSSYKSPSSQIDKQVEYSLLKIQNKSLKEQSFKSTETVSKLRKELQEKVGTLQKFNDLMKIKYAQIKTLKAQLETSKQRVKQLQDEKDNHVTKDQAVKIRQLYMIKSAQLDDVVSKINNLDHENFKNEIFQMKIAKLYDQLDKERTKNKDLMIEKSSLSQKIIELEEKVLTLEYENQKSQTINKVDQESERIEKLFSSVDEQNNSPTKQSRQSQHLNAFEEAIKVQLKQVGELKQTIQNSQEIIQSLKDNLISSRRELQELRNQMKIMSLKESTERKTLIMEYRLQLHEKDNQINNASKKYKTLDEKYKASLNDIKAKDEFLKQHLIGRLTDTTPQQYVQSTLKKYTENFEELFDLKAKNSELSQKLEKYLQYQREISNEIFENKQKI